VLTGWQLWHPAGQSYAELVMIDVATGKRRALLSAPEYNFSGPRVSPDGRLVVCQRETQATPEREGAEPVFVPRARYPLAGLLLALPALEATGLLATARQVYGRLKDGFYGLAATLLT
jgi:hypothetical protein